MSAIYAAVPRAVVGGDDERVVKMEEHVENTRHRSTNQEEPREDERKLPAAPLIPAAVVTNRERAWCAAEAIAWLFKRTKRANETFADFASALRDVGHSCDIGEELYVTAFIAGIDDEFTAALLRVVTPQSLACAAQEAARLRATDGAQKPKTAKKTRHHQRGRQQRQHYERASGPVTPVASVLAADDASPPQRVEKRTKKSMKVAEAEADSRPRKKRHQTCFACEQLGHIRRECPKKRARLH